MHTRSESGQQRARCASSLLCCTRQHPVTREEVGQQGQGKMSRSQGETGSGAARDPLVSQLEGIPSPRRPCIISWRAGLRPCGNPRPRLPCTLPAPPPCFPLISAIIIMHRGICHVGLLGALHHFPVFSSSSRHVGSETWSPDLVSLGKRRQILCVHMRECTSFFVSVNNQIEPPRRHFQTSHSSQIELIKTRRFLKQPTQTIPATVVGCLPAFSGLERCANM